MIHNIYIENLKCGGCANTIDKELSIIETVNKISIDVENSLITFEANENVLEQVKMKLSSLGYPTVGDKNTLLHKAKSFVSCATGRIK